MTCIVGIVDEGKVLIGADSAGVGGWDLDVRADTKVFKNGEGVFGFTSSFRMGQIIRYAFTLPEMPEGKDLMAYMATDFIDALRSSLGDGGYRKKDSERESGGTFLIGIRGRLFKIHSDFQVAESSSSFDACGCGEGYALGALFATEKANPRERIKIALAAAERYSAGVRGPFHVVTT